jgi:hypothetical protein
MSRKVLFFLLVACVLGAGTTTAVRADDLGSVLSKLAGDNAKNYVGPLMKGWGADLNSAWFHSADVHDLLGFDIQVKVGLAQLNDADKTYQFQMPSTISYTFAGIPRTFNSGVDYPATVTAPTAVGAADPVVVSTYKTANTFNQEIQIFTHPQGFNLPAAPLIMPQAALGLPFGIEAMVRYLPSYTTAVGKVSFLGYGARLGINRLIPVPLPIDIAIHFATQKLSFKDSTDAELISASATAYGIEISKSILFLTLYGGFQLENSSFNIGPYTAKISTGSSTTVVNVPQFTVDGANTSRILLGLRLHLLILTLHAEYGIATINTLSAGVGISFR